MRRRMRSGPGVEDTPGQHATPVQQAPTDIVEMVNAASTHPYWAQHTGELWVRVLAGVKERLNLEDYKTVCEVLIDTWNSIPVHEDVDAVQFELRLGHNCSAGACADGTCTLCVNSASRPCPQLFKSKYLLRDGIVPACGSAASVSIVRSGRPKAPLSPEDFQDLPPFVFQVCALPWMYYKEHKENIPWDTIHECKTITKEAGSPPEVEAVLACRDIGHMETDGFISFPHAVDSAQRMPIKQLLASTGVKLPEVFFPKRSAEALLDGKRPQLVLVVRAVHAHTGAPLPAILPAASTPFHVATRRTRGNEKAYIPSTDQEVRVLEHIGDACIKKLKDLPEHVREHPEVVLPASIPEGRVLTVAHMAALVAAVENDKTAESKLFLKTLKLNDDRLAELKEQLKRAVRPDSQLRVFYCGTYPEAPLPGLLDGPVDVGLVFTCTRGTVDLHEGGICGVVMRSQLNGAAAAMEAIVPRDHLIQEPQLKPLLLMHARRAWRAAGHPGWGFYTLQGRATSRMPPEGAAKYPVDPNRIPCFTPCQYADAPEGAAAGAGGAADPGAARGSSGHGQQSGTPGSAAADGPHPAGGHSAAEDAGGARQPEGYASMAAMHAAHDVGAAMDPASRAAAADLAGRAAAAQPRPAAAGAAPHGRADVGAGLSHTHPHTQLVSAPQQATLPISAAGAVGSSMPSPVTVSAWMNTHELAAAAASRPPVSQGTPLALFQPSPAVAPARGLVRPRAPGAGEEASGSKCLRSEPGGAEHTYTAGQPQNAEADPTAGHVPSAAFLSLSGLSGLSDLQNSQNQGLAGNLLLSNGTRSAAPASSDLGSLLFSNMDSLQAGTPGGSIELAA